MKKMLITLALIMWGAAAFAQQTAKGYVYHDKNADGKKDRSENGIASVAVSNGSQIVLTDKNGYYEIPVSEGNIVFAIKPSGYSFPLDENNMPIYYYIHKPAGSPAHYKFQGVEPTGKLPRLINFALLPYEEPDDFRALIFGDPQMRGEEMLGFFERKIVSELVGIENVAFGVSMGDVSDEDLDLMGPIKEVTAKIGVPWYYVNGNHDTNYDADEDILANETFIRYYGPPDYSFNYAGAHMLVLDDIMYPDPRETSRKRVGAGFREDQRQFIENDLALVDKDKLVIVMAHIPFISGWVNPDDVRFLFEKLHKFDNVLIITAHTHMQQHLFHTASAGWNKSEPLHQFNVGTTCGSWYSGFFDEDGIPEATMVDGTPQGYAFLNVKGNQYTIDYKVAGKPDDYHMSISHPKVVIKDKHTPSYITVNFFMGYETDVVEFRLDGGAWQEMKHTVMPDPAYQNMYYRWEQSDVVHTNRWPSEPVNSKHIWRVRIPCRGIEAGVHKIEVRATNLFGRTVYGESSYTIAEPINTYYP